MIGSAGRGLAAGTVGAGGRGTLPALREAAAFADGAQWLGAPRRGETRLTLNYARALVRKTAAYVFPGPVTFRVPPAPGQDAARRRGPKPPWPRRSGGPTSAPSTPCSAPRRRCSATPPSR
jgi:hypothetical protein